MSNTFNISVKPEIAALSALVQDNQTEIAGIRGADLIALIAEIDENQTLLVDVTNPGIVNLASALANCQTDITTIYGIVDAIKTKTDLFPQDVRGHFTTAKLTTQSSDFVVLSEVTGRGKIWKLSFTTYSTGETIEIKLTLDGIVFNTFSFEEIVESAIYSLGPSGHGAEPPSLNISYDDTFVFNAEFDTSFKVEVRRTAGSQDNYFYVHYFLDAF